MEGLAMSRNEKNKKWFIVMAAVIVCFAFAGAARAGTNWSVPVTLVTERQKLLASDGATADQFGCSVFISGDYAIVGALYDDDKGSNSGSAYIFKWNGTSWSQQQKLTASDGAAGDWFGTSVSISGDYVIVGASRDDDNGTDSGSAYIFTPNDIDPNNWVQQQKLTASDGAVSDNFGYSVSISGDYAIVGAYRDDDNGTDSGSAYIFKWDGTSWSQQQKLTASDGAVWDYFGRSVSISGDYAIVGAENNGGKGSAYIFKRNGTIWSQQAKLTASDRATNDYFGSVSINGDYAIVGAYGDDGGGDDGGKGSAYIFNRDGTSWSQQQKLTASDGAAWAYFGRSVSISGDYVIVGAEENDASGSAYIFWRDGISWSQQAKLTASDGAAGDYFGWSVSISGDYAIVGASYDDDKGTDSGSAYIFFPCAIWPTADLTGDCRVDFEDFAVLANQWLQCGDPFDTNCVP
jgi:hypothetical protein